jgi:Glycosyltransferase
MKSNKIICFHLSNGYTGSPKVLQQVVLGLQSKGYLVEIVTNKEDGFLSDLKNLKYRFIHYKWTGNKFITFLFLILAQIEFFFITLFQPYGTTIYINTLLPFGAAWAGKIRKLQVVYHVHEKYIVENALNNFLKYSYNICKTKSIFVSNYLRGCYQETNNYKIIYNSLDIDFVERANEFLSLPTYSRETILLVASVRKYKGIYEFIELSKSLPDYTFELIISCTEFEFKEFLTLNFIPSNLKIYANQKDLHKFYQRAKIVLNLSLIDSWVETFGLTILEAMAYGIPTIVPPVGGTIELVEDGINGFHVDSRNFTMLTEKLVELMTEDDIYVLFSKNALIKSKVFDYQTMISDIEDYI